MAAVIQGGYRTKANQPRGPGGRLMNRQVDFTSEDMTTSAGYYNFNMAQGQERAVQQMPKMDWDKYVEPPANVKCYTITVDPEKMVCFSGRGHYLSPMNGGKITIDNCVYQSVEHYYQATKLFMLAGSQYSNRISRIADAGSAKQFAKQTLRGIQPPAKIEQWRRMEGIRMIDYAVRHKFRQNEALRDKLIKTEGFLLVHSYDRDTVFASGKQEEDMKKWAEENKGKVLKIPVSLTPETQKYFPKVGNGKNLLGAILMRTRDRLINAMQGKPDPEDDQTDPMLLASMDALKIELEEKDKEISKLKAEKGAN